MKFAGISRGGREARRVERGRVGKREERSLNLCVAFLLSPAPAVPPSPFLPSHLVHGRKDAFGFTTSPQGAH